MTVKSLPTDEDQMVQVHVAEILGANDREWSIQGGALSAFAACCGVEGVEHIGSKEDGLRVGGDEDCLDTAADVITCLLQQHSTAKFANIRSHTRQEHIGCYWA